MKDPFGQSARKISDIVGSPWAFVIAVLVVFGWALLGPVLNYSSRWQLFINTGTTIVTFLMVFLIQSAQNRDQAELQLKLDELLRAIKGARTGFVDLTNLSEKQIDELRDEFAELAAKHVDELPGSRSAMQQQTKGA